MDQNMSQKQKVQVFAVADPGFGQVGPLDLPAVCSFTTKCQFVQSFLVS